MSPTPLDKKSKTCKQLIHFLALTIGLKHHIQWSKRLFQGVICWTKKNQSDSFERGQVTQYFPEARWESAYATTSLHAQHQKQNLCSRWLAFCLWSETAEIHENRTLRSWVVKRVDTEGFIKIYSNYLSVEFDLSQRALMVLQYFVTALKFNDERVIFDLKAAARVTGYFSKQSIVMPLAELIDAEIIARSPAPNIYYINPKVFVKGNRIVMV